MRNLVRESLEGAGMSSAEWVDRLRYACAALAGISADVMTAASVVGRVHDALTEQAVLEASRRLAAEYHLSESVRLNGDFCTVRFSRLGLRLATRDEDWLRTTNDGVVKMGGGHVEGYATGRG